MTYNGKRRLLVLLLPLLAVLGLLGLTGDAQAQTTGAAPALVQLRTNPVYEELLPNSSAGLSSSAGVKDYAGNAFDMFLRTVGNDTRVIIQKRDPQGNLVGAAEVHPSGSRKLNSADLFIDGSDVAVRVTAYDLTSPSRINAYEAGRWQGVAVPFPNGVNPALGKGPVTYDPAQAPDAEPIDYNRIKNDVATEVMNRLRAEYGGNIRQGIEDKNKDALVELMTRNFDPKSNAFLDKLAPFVRDRAYEADIAYCQTHACGLPLATPTPRP